MWTRSPHMIEDFTKHIREQVADSYLPIPQDGRQTYVYKLRKQIFGVQNGYFFSNQPAAIASLWDSILSLL